MSDENADFVVKLRQIEEQANATGVELGPGIAKTRLQQIVVLAKTLRGRLEFGRLTLVRTTASTPPPGEPKPAA
jgi:hypothetical protein